MGALARLLGRREDLAAPGARAMTAARSGGSGARGDLLHASGLETGELRAAWMAVSWLLSYPDEQIRGQWDTVAALAERVPGAAGEGLRGALAAVRAEEPLALQERYVDTFDTRRRGCLHLTYFSNGDTRRRGMALLRIKQDLRSAGLTVDEHELPDHLPLVLEFAAAHDPERGAKILRANRPGVELLRLHLADIASPWHGALLALCATLPPLDADDRAAVMRLAEQGPEEETVGLDGYAAEGYGGDGLDRDALDLSGRTWAATSCGDGAAAPGPVPLDLMRGRPS